MQIRWATAEDAETIHRFIVELAVYEREPDAVKATTASLREQLASQSPPFEALIAEEDAGPVGFALFFHNYSTWRGKRGLYLEDLYVTPAARGKGYGKALLRRLAGIAVERDCPRMDWWVLNWNEPAIAFYESLDAVPMKDWTVYRLTDDALRRLADS